MKRKSLSLCLLLLYLLTCVYQLKAQTEASEHYVTFTTEKKAGESLMMLAASSDLVTELKVEGATPNEDGTYTLTQSTIKIVGDVGSLIISEEKITHLDTSHAPNLSVLIAVYNNISQFDASGNPLLATLMLPHNPITQINLKENRELLELFVYDGKLSDLDLSQCSKLSALSCSRNKLTHLDIRSNTALKELRASGNQLSAIDLSQNLQLEQIDLAENKLTQLDFPSLPNLGKVYIYGNAIPQTAMKAIVAALPSREEKAKALIMVINTEQKPLDGNICTVEEVATATAKKWSIYDYKGGVNKGAGVLYTGSTTALDSVTPATSLRLYLNPTHEQLSVASRPHSNIALLSIEGELLATQATDTQEVANFEVSHLSSGASIVVAQGLSSKVLIAN